MINQELYCFMHNIEFDNPDLYEEHKVKCGRFLEKINVCKQHAIDGAMCGRSFRTTTALYQHSLDEHNVVICELCDAQSTDKVEMQRHSHKKRDVPSIHRSG